MLRALYRFQLKRGLLLVFDNFLIALFWSDQTNSNYDKSKRSRKSERSFIWNDRLSWKPSKISCQTETNPKLCASGQRYGAHNYEIRSIYRNERLSLFFHCTLFLSGVKCLFFSFFSSGPNAWRHSQKPFSILEQYCEMTMKPFTYFPGKKENPDRIVIADREYTLAPFG